MIKGAVAIAIARQSPDQFVIVFDYEDAEGNVSRRVASPYRHKDHRFVEAFCFHSGEIRRFLADKMSSIELADANDFLTPMPKLKPNIAE